MDRTRPHRIPVVSHFKEESGSPRLAHVLVHAREFARAAWASMDEARTFGVVSEMDFWLFLALVPLAAIAAILVARFGLSSGA